MKYEQSLVQLFNDTIPNLKLTAGLRDFAGERWLTRPFMTKLWYGMAPYVKQDLGKTIFEINTYGVESPLDLALDAATTDLKPLAGQSAVSCKKNSEGSHARRALYEKPSQLSTVNQRMQPISCNIM